MSDSFPGAVVINEIREVRHRIWEKFGHDPEKIVAHHMKLQELYRDRLIGRMDVTTPSVPAKANSASQLSDMAKEALTEHRAGLTEEFDLDFEV